MSAYDRPDRGPTADRPRGPRGGQQRHVTGDDDDPAGGDPIIDRDGDGNGAVTPLAYTLTGVSYGHETHTLGAEPGTYTFEDGCTWTRARGDTGDTVTLVAVAYDPIPVLRAAPDTSPS